MRLALGLKAHSGWAALVAVGRDQSGIKIVERTRLELVAVEDTEWAKQPFHAAENRPLPEARELVDRAVASIRRISVREIASIVASLRTLDHDVVACAVLVPAPMPDWSVDEILAVHFRMHKAEGVLFPDALVRAARANQLQTAEIPEKELDARAERELATSRARLMKDLERVGKQVGPPWGKDQKCATLAALIALKNHPS
jgi:hypothetical protein